MKEKQKLSEIFLKAARYRSMGRGACVAIEHAMGGDVISWSHSKPHRFFNALFRPTPKWAAYYFKKESGTVYCETISEREANARRRTALLLAAEIAESEGL